MSEVNNGLRFDIYERVHLPDNVAAIDELEEIELVPRIQVIEQGDQAVLQGQLVLNGIYRAQGAGEEQVALEHWIPVEISLPMNRVSRIEEITVDIDTFDVVLLSSRALNITGVLSLRGITLEHEEEVSEWETEAFTVSHERSESEEEAVEWAAERTEAQQSESYEAVEAQRQFTEDEVVESEPYYASYLQEEQTSEQLFAQTQAELHIEQYEAARQDEQYEVEQTVDQQEVAGHEEMQAVLYTYNDEALEREAEAQQYTADAYVEEPTDVAHEAASNPWGQFASEAPLEQGREQQEYEVHEVEQAEQTEQESVETAYIEEVESDNEPTSQERSVHIALNSSSNQNETLGIRSVLTSSLREQAAHQANLLQLETERQLEEASKPHVVDEEIEWQQLFLSKRPDQNEFRRIRMCIVQKEDTLEQIAGRYSINPRELLVRNNLHESAISEGQLLYLP